MIIATFILAIITIVMSHYTTYNIIMIKRYLYKLVTFVQVTWQAGFEQDRVNSELGVE